MFGNARVYLGLIEPSDGVAGALGRLEVAHRHLEDFGLATACTACYTASATSQRQSGHRRRWVADDPVEMQKTDGYRLLVGTVLSMKDNVRRSTAWSLGECWRRVETSSPN